LRSATTFAAWVFVGVLAARSAGAFCRETSCQIVPLPNGCVGTYDANGCSNEGIALHWGQPCLSFSVHQGGSPKSGISSAQLEQQVRAAFDSWSTASCSGGGTPNLTVETYPPVLCSEVGFRSEGPNQNLWIFRDDSWEHEIDAEGTLALTTLSVVTSTGEIYDADVELNAKDNTFTLGGAGVETDLYSIVLHEAGHVLGIAHSPWPTSTMSDSYDRGSLDARSLEADDINAICAIMPPGEPPSQCDPEPRHGFSTRCDAAEDGCCSMARGRHSDKAQLLVLVGLLLLAATRRRGAEVPSQTSNRCSPRDDP
jgi:hypothetical protein